MDTKILSGKDVSITTYQALQSRIKALKSQSVVPGLAVLLVGEDAGSQIYIRNKTKKFADLGLHSNTFQYSSSISQEDLLLKIRELNNDDRFHGILVQLPLPKHINKYKVLSAMDPKKDVDGFHPSNLGLLLTGKPYFIPCTPKGIMRILAHYQINLSGKNVVVVGRSNIVGRPISILTSLKQEYANATTTICHSGTPDIFDYTKRADIIILAIGSPNFLKGNHIKAGSVIIDVGINRVEDHSPKGYKIVGDGDETTLMGKASAITPVPGGVGPMTIAMLIENTIEAAERLLD
ncbi:MAG TPA: bifunctional 5,10-methylenetetrahydrofolate dehydrogenase/5,10-methenyltetrahydrofolate cyclohydrolase [Candidatus Marinimicrobia bacterium]|mgnify:FL=1|jgi:methylenetetrahydrofolate dehydrogenase (NADP+)/methenyltetrahydrofolate cyclohydrolase|nr:bifunctional 5,10-methylenetetrahydrofolate dehydrogenase/5,10-methenyltetrahydrofolate cyclohydrolase [Candidatus Neomarinimicrobiota bacterium]HIM74365.1 bifunctional 5,10-methylenetetrahydrofolate dehydrogenase/5,10-methenyltetrahydrofolate cyclohydrolase [Candidatus Neomarinimicrobiota bacterium]